MSWHPMSPHDWDDRVLELPEDVREKAREIIAKLWASEQKPFLAGMEWPERWQKAFDLARCMTQQHYQSIAAGIMAKRNRIARRGYRRGMPWFRGWPVAWVTITMNVSEFKASMEKAAASGDEFAQFLLGQEHHESHHT